MIKILSWKNVYSFVKCFHPKLSGNDIYTYFITLHISFVDFFFGNDGS